MQLLTLLKSSKSRNKFRKLLDEWKNGTWLQKDEDLKKQSLQ